MEAETVPQKLYKTFKETKQEPLRLDSALKGFFLENAEQTHKEEYLQYLKRRIRPAMEYLIKHDDIEKIQTLEKLGLFGEKELESFIQMARSQGKMISLMWFLQLKDRKYGYQDHDFSL